MSPGVIAALITAIASLIAAPFTAVWAARSQAQRATEERRVGAKAELDRYREPLLFAANELGNRIHNIRNKEFLYYFGIPDHREHALLGTLFRFGQYFARLEMLYTNLSLMHFEKDKDTKAVAGLIRHIAGTFASDGLRPEELSPTDRYVCFDRFMVWREEQRGIGEMMCEEHDGKPTSYIGYASFVNQYDKCYSKWFTLIAKDLESFAGDLRSGVVDDSERLRLLQGWLAKLVTQLDEEEAYKALNEKWIARAEEPSERTKKRRDQNHMAP
jgi:hypothetical protein